MKINKKIAVVLIILSGTAIHLSGQTLKERIDLSKEIKVYFRNADIVSKANTQTKFGTTISGSGCENFKETIPMPAEYDKALKQIVDLLNNGFNTEAFVAGNFSVIDNLPVTSSGDLNWLRLGEPLAFFISTSGAYYTRRSYGSFVREHTLEVESFLYVYSVTEGKLKLPVSKMLAWAKTEKIETDKCEDYAWFVKTFPAASLAEPFKNKLIENTTDFIAKEMDKYEKAMKKKK